jgi:hypothetical protein
MKLKLSVLTALTLASVALSAAPASAWWLHHNCGCNRYSTVIVCRPYNAFTPVCSGSLVCDGCCPFSCPNLPSGACCSPTLGNPLLSMCHDPAGINGGQYMMQPMMQGPPMAMPGQQFQGPMPMPANMQQTQAPMPYPVQPANYQQGYYPVYYTPYANPMAAYPYQQQAPAYWYGY